MRSARNIDPQLSLPDGDDDVLVEVKKTGALQSSGMIECILTQYDRYMRIRCTPYDICHDRMILIFVGALPDPWSHWGLYRQQPHGKVMDRSIWISF